MPEYKWKNPYYHVWDLYKETGPEWGRLIANLVIVKGYFMGRIYPNAEWTQVKVKLLRDAKAALIELYEKESNNA